MNPAFHPAADTLIDRTKMKSLKSKALKIVACIALVLVLSWLYIVDRKLRGESMVREANFITLHYLALQRLEDGSWAGPPRTFSDLLGEYKWVEGRLMEPFPQGLVYRPTKDGFALEEPTPHVISLFQRDRLVSTEKKWPRWERSHKYANKGLGQVPPKGFE